VNSKLGKELKSSDENETLSDWEFLKKGKENSWAKGEFIAY
jgi:hypothetical protein